MDTSALCYGSATPAPGQNSQAPDPLCTTPAPTVSFAKDIAPIFSGCSGEVCHAPWRYDTVVEKNSSSCCDHRLLVQPSEPSQSHIVQALTGNGACVPRMPLAGRLSDSAVATIVAWICQGAADN